MSAHHRLRTGSALKKVLNKLGDSYQTYFNTYKTHIMATHYGGTSQPLERDLQIQGYDMDAVHDYWEDTNNLEHEEHENQCN